MSENSDTFGKMGNTFQEKVVQSIIIDPQFADQMADILQPKFFDLKYLEVVAEKVFSHKRKYKTFPSLELIEIMVSKDSESDPLVTQQVKSFIERVQNNPLNGDSAYIQESALDFCKRQCLKEAMITAIDKIEESKYDEIQSVIKEALSKGNSHDLGHDYSDNLRWRASRGQRQPLSTGWPVLDKALNGGWERKTLTTFIAPTGAGKSMFLVNCGAAALAAGLNVVYITCEMADYKIGLRFDSYFSGIEINSISSQQEKVETILTDKVKGKLYIKEFPTKTASTQTIRSYLQRLQATKNFIPDMLVVDYADLLRGSRGYGDKRFELESIYEELRAIAQEFNIVLITADQTNRSGLDMEVVTIGQIGESYAKATVCDVIITVSRRAEDKQANSGRIFLAKSRLGSDGIVFPFLMNTATVKATILEQGVDPIALFLENNANMKAKMGERYDKLVANKNA